MRKQSSPIGTWSLLLATLFVGWYIGARRTQAAPPLNISVTVSRPAEVAPVMKTLETALPPLENISSK